MEKCIRILHVGLSDNVGGIETVVKSWFDHKPEDIEFDFVNNNSGELAFSDEFLKSGSHIFKIPSRKENYKGSKEALERIIREGAYDYLHFHAMSLSWPEPILSTKKNAKTQGIIHSHMVVDSNMSTKYRILHMIGKIRLNHVKYLELACGIDAGRSMFGNSDYRVIPNGIELDKYYYSKEKREQIRKRFGLSEDMWVIGHVGRPGPQKNYPFLFKTVSEIIDTDITKNIRLLLLGDIKEDSEIKDLVQKYKLKDHVIFAGYVEDSSPYYSAMDCFFFPSLYEGFSVSLVEAQAAGLPCVSSKNVAEESKLTDRFIFVDIQDTSEAKRALDEFRNNMSNRIIHKQLPYDIKNTSKEMFDYYRKNLK